jgi:putative transposase
LVDGEGGPLGVVLAAANVNDQKLLGQTIEAVVIERPDPTPEEPQHLCLDASYDNPTGRTAAEAGKYTPHIVSIRKQQRSTKRKRGRKARRWVVERTLAWLCKCRGILIRYDKKDENYLGLIQLACALFWYRRLDRLAGANATQPQLHRS